jgi:hypothetical protein
MNVIRKRISNYLNNADESIINKLILQLPYAVEENKEMETKRKMIYENIFSNYIDYRAETMQFENELKCFESIEELCDKFGQSKIVIAFQLYRFNKFCRTNYISDYLKQLGVRNMYQEQFLDLEIIENTLFDILKSGVLVNLQEYIKIIDLSIDIRILREFRNHHIEIEIVEKYDGIKNVSKMDILLRNIDRKRKYYSATPKEINGFEKMMSELINSHENPNTFSKFLRKAINNRPTNEIKKMMIFILNPYIDNIGRPTVIKIFKNFFHLLFENNNDGLLTENNFEIQNENNEEFTGKYNGNYNKYYSTRVKTLLGI